MTNLDMLKQAKVFFKDSAEYDEYELLGFWRLMNDVYKGYYTDARPQYLYIDIIKEILGRRKKNEYEVIRYKYWDGCTLKEIGEKLSFSTSYAHQLKAAVIRRLRRSFGSYSVEAIKLLRLNERLTGILNAHYIYSISSLTLHTAAEIMAYNGVTEQDIHEINDALAMLGASLNRKPYWVKGMGISPKAVNLLQENGIIKVDRLLSMSETQLKAINGIDEETIQEIQKAKKSLFD